MVLSNFRLTVEVSNRSEKGYIFSIFMGLVMRKVVFRVIVNFLDYYLLICSDIKVVSLQAGCLGFGHSGSPLPLVTHARKHIWEQALGDQAPGLSASSSHSTISGEAGLWWSNLGKRSDFALEINFQDSFDHGICPTDVKMPSEGTN